MNETITDFQTEKSKSGPTIKKLGKMLKQPLANQNIVGTKITNLSGQSYYRESTNSPSDMYPSRRVRTEIRIMNGLKFSCGKKIEHKRQSIYDSFKQKKIADEMTNIVKCHPELTTTVLLKN